MEALRLDSVRSARADRGIEWTAGLPNSRPFATGDLPSSVCFAYTLVVVTCHRRTSKHTSPQGILPMRRAPYLVFTLLFLATLPMAWAAPPESADVSLGVKAYLDGSYREAEVILNTAVESGSKDPLAYYFRGLVRWNAGDQAGANEDFAEAARLELKAKNTGRTLQRWLEPVQGPARVALEAARSRAQQSVRRAGATNLQAAGIEAYYDGDYSVAAELLISALRQGNRDPVTYYFYGLVAHRMGDDDVARKSFESGVLLESRQGRTETISRALERVQGSDRLAVAEARQSLLSRIAVESNSANDRAMSLARAARVDAERELQAAIAQREEEKAEKAEMLAKSSPQADSTPAPVPMTPPASKPEPTPTAPVEEPLPERPAGLDLAWFPVETEFLVVVRVADILRAPLLRSLIQTPDVEAGLAQVQQMSGVDPRMIESVMTGASGLTEIIGIAANGPPDPTALAALATGRSLTVITLKQPIDRDQLAQVIPGAQSVTRGSAEYLMIPPMAPDAPTGAVFFANDTTVVAGDEAAVQAAIDRGPSSTPLAAFTFLDPQADLTIAFVPQDPDALLSQAPPAAGGMPPPVQALYTAVTGGTQAVALSLAVDRDVDIALHLNCRSEDAAQEIRTSAGEAITMGRAMYGQFKDQVPPPFQRLTDRIVTSVKATNRDTVAKVSLTIPSTVQQLIENAPALLMPLLQGGPMGPPGGFGPPGEPPSDTPSDSADSSSSESM